MRTDEDFSADPRFIPGAARRDYASVTQWADTLHGCSAIVIGQKGAKISQGVAAWLRHAGADAITLDGGQKLGPRRACP